MESEKIKKRVAENLKELRKARKLTQFELALDFEKEIKLSVKDEITKCLRKYIDEKMDLIKLE